MAKKHSIAKKYGYLLVTLILFSGFIIGHWYYGFQQEYLGRQCKGYANWQSQLI
jgi:hypothetical protein